MAYCFFSVYLALKEKLPIVAHNASYDFACLLEHYPELTDEIFAAYENNRVLCTKVREKLINIALGEKRGRQEGDRWIKNLYSLDALTQRYGGDALDKGSDSWRLRYKELEDTPIAHWPPRARDYALNDAIEGYRVFYEQEKRVAALRTGKIPTQYSETRADLGLTLQAPRGWTFGLAVDNIVGKMTWRHNAEKRIYTVGRLDERIYDAGVGG